MDCTLFLKSTERAVENCSKIIVGKEDKIRLIFTAFLCSGHVLLEDVPGTGKTMLLRAFAKTVGSDFKRIQFTPDLLPSDLTGINFYNQKPGRRRPGAGRTPRSFWPKERRTLLLQKISAAPR